MYVCICHAVTEDEVHLAICGGAADEHAVAEASGAGTGCGSCVARICEMIRGHERAFAGQLTG